MKKIKLLRKSVIAKWIIFILIEVFFICLFSSGFYRYREITIDECEKLVTEIIDIKTHRIIDSPDVIYVQTNAGDYYFHCYECSIENFPIKEILAEKKLTMFVKREKSIIYHPGLREIVDLRSDTNVYLDFKVYADYAKTERISGYIIAPILLLGITVFGLIKCLGINTIIRFTFCRKPHKKKK